MKREASRSTELAALRRRRRGRGGGGLAQLFFATTNKMRDALKANRHSYLKQSKRSVRYDDGMRNLKEKEEFKLFVFRRNTDYRV